MKKQKKVFATIICISLFLSILSVQSAEAGMISDMQSATEICENQIYEGTVTGEIDSDWFVLSTDNDYKDYYVNLYTTNDTMCRIYIYDSNATLVDEKDLSFEYSWCIELEENSTYYYRIATYQDANCDYIFGIKTEREASDKMEHAEDFKIGDMQEGEVSNENDEDWFKFTAPAFANYTLICSNHSNTDSIHLYVCKSEGYICSWSLSLNSIETLNLELKKGDTIYVHFGCSSSNIPVKYTFIVNQSTITTLEGIPEFSKLIGGSKRVTLLWDSIEHAKGYQIRYSESYSMRKAKIVTVKGTKKTLLGLKKGKKYYFQIRAYAINDKGKRVYSEWSYVRSKKTLK